MIWLPFSISTSIVDMPLLTIADHVTEWSTLVPLLIDVGFGFYIWCKCFCCCYLWQIKDGIPCLVPQDGKILDIEDTNNAAESPGKKE